MELTGKDLKVLSISRKGMFDEAAMVYSCDNCGRAIVNYAEVTDGLKNYIIGLDCKKTLIDKKLLIELLKNEPEIFHKYKTKQFNSEINEVTKMLLESSRENVEFDIDERMNWFSIKDWSQKNDLGLMGKITYSQNLNFLYKMGLKEYIQKLKNK